LEPSAGDGAIADVVDGLPYSRDLVCVEPDEARAAILEGKGYDVAACTLEEYVDATSERFDAVVMNPPFATPGHPVLWAEHVLLARSLLTPNGMLASVIPGNLERQNQVVGQVRDLVYEDGAGSVVDLPADAFKAAGTGVRTKLLVLHAGG